VLTFLILVQSRSDSSIIMSWNWPWGEDQASLQTNGSEIIMCEAKYKFGSRSLENLSEAHQDLQRLFHEVIRGYDCSVIEGFRNREEQQKAFHSGKSHLEFPNSNHNKKPTDALDVAPYPISWKKEDIRRFYHFAGYVKGIADKLGIMIRWGGDWDGDFEFKDQNFHDLPHYELLKV